VSGNTTVGSRPGSVQRRILVNFVSLAASAWSQQFFNFLVVVWVARVLGVGALGQIMLAQAVVMYFRLAADLGLDLLGNRRMARDPGHAAAVVAEFTGARLINASLAFAALAVTAAVVNSVRPPVGWIIMAFGCQLLPFALSLEWAFSGLERMEWVGAYRFVAAATLLALVLTFVRHPGAVFMVPLANVAAISAAALLLFFLFRRRFGQIVPVFRLAAWRALIREAAPTGLSLLLIQVYVGFGVVATGLMEGDRAAGLFGAAQKLLLFLTAISSMFGAALYPRLSAVFRAGQDPFGRLLSAGVRVMLTVGVPIGVGGVLVAPALLPAVYGGGYEPSVAVCRWLMPSLILSFTSIPFGYALLAAGRQRAYFRASLAGAVLNIVGTVALVPALHLIGPAVATLGTEAVVLVILVVASRDVARVRVGRQLASVTLAGGTMAAAILFLHPASLAGQIALGALVYAAVLAGTGGIRRSDVSALVPTIGS
jgi:O-antigen/teichoic acid export membrane protein